MRGTTLGQLYVWESVWTWNRFHVSSLLFFFPWSLGVLLAIVHFGQGVAGVLSQSLLALLGHRVVLPL